MLRYIKDKIAGKGRSKQRPFRLMDLPPHIRNKVYQFALSYGEDGVIRPCAPLPPLRPVEYKRWLYQDNLLFVNAEIRSETLPIYYSCNDFELQDLQQVHFFLNAISSQCRDWITTLRIKLDKIEHDVLAFDYIVQLPRLRKLHLQFDYRTFRYVYIPNTDRHHLFYTRPFATMIRSLHQLRGIEELVIEESYFSGTDTPFSNFMSSAATEEVIHEFLAPVLALPSYFVDIPPWVKEMSPIETIWDYYTRLSWG